MQGTYLHLRVSSRRKAKIPGAYSFGISRFAKSGCTRCPCSLEPPVVEKPKCLTPLDFGILCFMKLGYKEYPYSLESLVAEKPKCPMPINFRILRFTKSGYKGYPCYLESLVTEKPKFPNVETPKCLSIQSMAHNNPFDQWLTSNHDFAISQFGVLRDKNLCLSNFQYPKSQNGPTV
jgi:hypothetical protein